LVEERKKREVKKFEKDFDAANDIFRVMGRSRRSNGVMCGGR